MKVYTDVIQLLEDADNVTGTYEEELLELEEAIAKLSARRNWLKRRVEDQP